MNDADIPILKKTYELYKLFHEYRKVISKANRFTIYERCENLIIDLIEYFFEAGYAKTANKSVILDKASVRLNSLRLFVRLMKETYAIDNKKYLALQTIIDEIGRMLGGWIRSTSSAN
jgi:hypothetical protein